MKKATESNKLDKLKNIDIRKETQGFFDYGEIYLINKRRCRKAHKNLEDIVTDVK